MAGFGALGILIAIVLAAVLLVLAVFTPFFIYRIYQESIETNRILLMLYRLTASGPADAPESASRTGREFSR